MNYVKLGSIDLVSDMPSTMRLVLLTAQEHSAVSKRCTVWTIDFCSQQVLVTLNCPYVAMVSGLPGVLGVCAY